MHSQLTQVPRPANALGASFLGTEFAVPFRDKTGATSSRIRSWNGMTAELVEMRAPFRQLQELPSKFTRLIMLLDEAGGRVEFRLAPDSPPQSLYRGPNHLSFVPGGTSVWLNTGTVNYCRYIVITFDVDRLAAVLPEPAKARQEMRPRLMFSEPTILKYGKLIAAECEEPESINPIYGESLAVAILCALLPAKSDQRKTGGQCLAPWQLRRVNKLMEEKAAEKLHLAELAATVGISISHFSRAFKGSTGLPPHQWHMTLRVKRAQALIAADNGSLADIACATGFADQSHFSRVFSKLVGDSPGAWRRAHLR